MVSTERPEIRRIAMYKCPEAVCQRERVVCVTAAPGNPMPVIDDAFVEDLLREAKRAHELDDRKAKRAEN